MDFVRTGYTQRPQVVDAALAGIEGSVWHKVLIDEKGKVRVARILKDSGCDVGFEAAALESAKKSTWKPAVKDGDRVPIWVTYEAAFSLIATKEGKPIHQIDRWHWAVRDLIPNLSQSHEQDERLDEVRPDPFAFAQIDERPIQTKQIPSIYPEYARKKEFEGSVWVSVLVDCAGRVAQVKVAKESGCNCGFEEEALLSAVNSKWKAAKQGGVPVSLWVTYEVRFVLRR